MDGSRDNRFALPCSRWPASISGSIGEGAREDMEVGTARPGDAALIAGDAVEATIAGEEGAALRAGGGGAAAIGENSSSLSVSTWEGSERTPLEKEVLRVISR